jgi:phage baseplate assembly protein W
MANLNDYSKPNSKVNANKDIYADLDILFSANPISGDITTKKDSDAVKRSVRNILLTNHYERPFKPNFGANLRAMLFELDGIGAKKRIKKNIITTLSILEPRIGNVKVDISESESNNIDVRVSYIIRNGLKQSSVDFKVSRVR